MCTIGHAKKFLCLIHVWFKAPSVPALRKGVQGVGVLSYGALTTFPWLGVSIKVRSGQNQLLKHQYCCMSIQDEESRRL